MKEGRARNRMLRKRWIVRNPVVGERTMLRSSYWHDHLTPHGPRGLSGVITGRTGTSFSP